MTSKNRRIKPVETVVKRLMELSTQTSTSPTLTRHYLSKEHDGAIELIKDWMRDAGMTVRVDDAATVIGRYPGTSDDTPALLVGSHIDTVPNAGRFDGCLGVVLAIEAVAELSRLKERLPFAVEVAAFGDHERARFPTTRTGSRALAGKFDPAELDCTDDDGVILREAITRFGGNPDNIAALALKRNELAGYFEVHIEQGQVLENDDLPVGVVTSITGVTCLAVELHHLEGYASCAPNATRRDAAAAAAEMILRVEEIARANPGLVATVPRLKLEPGAAHTVAYRASFSIELRSPSDRTRRAGELQVERAIRNLARQRRFSIDIATEYEEAAAHCDARLIEQLSAAVERADIVPFGLPALGCHDGLSMSHLCPIGMLSVRCKGGFSHHPSEYVATEDIEIALNIALDFIRKFDLGANRP